MMNRLKQILRGVLMVSVITMVMSFEAMAARIAFSDPDAEAGKEVTVNMKISGGDNETINSSNVMLSYDPQYLQFMEGTGATGDAGSVRVVGEASGSTSKELAFTLKFRALKAGTTTISISTQEVYDKDGKTVSVGQEGKSTVTITGEAPVEGAALLADLQISPGTLTPAFSPDVDSYSAFVESDVESVAISAPAADGTANVSVSGNEGLQMGENEILCVVTSGDGQTAKTYRIMVTRGESQGGDTSIVAQVSLRVDERTVTVLSDEEDIEVPEGFIKCSVNIDGKAVRGWIWNDKENPGAQPEYCIFYALNEEGEKGFYRYDRKERTLQRYFRDPAGSSDLQDQFNATAEEYNSLLHDYEIRFWIIIGLIVLSVILLIALIVLIAGRSQKDDFIEKRDDDNEWEVQKKTKRQKLTKEEQYLRGLEAEEEEAEREEDLAFIRRVQSGAADRGYQARGQAPAGRPGPRQGTQTNLNMNRGTAPVPRGAQRSPGQTAGAERGGRPGMAPGARGGQTGMIPAARGGQQNTAPGGRPNPKGQPGNVPDDDDFEVIDLE